MAISASGLISGLDVNNIIEELMHLERQPILRKEARIEQTEAIKELWREVNSALDTYQRTLTPLLDEKTYTAPVPKSSNEDVLTASIGGIPDEGTYRFDVTRLASYHSVAMDPPTAGQRIADPEAELGYNGTFFLGTGRQPEGVDFLQFTAETNQWLCGSFGAGFQAYISGEEEDVYYLEIDQLEFTEEMELGGAETIKVYMDSFTGDEGDDLTDELEDYYAEKGWDVDLEEPLFEIRKEGEDWMAVNQNGDPFAIAGDQPLGIFGLRGEIDDGDGDVLAVESFDFAIREEGDIDETALITLKEEDSLLTVAQRINQVSEETGVEADLVRVGDDDYRLTLESTVEGKEGFIQAYDFVPLGGESEEEYGTDRVLELLHLVSPDSGAAGPDYLLETQEALDAEFLYNGLKITRSSNTFNDVVSGVEVVLNGTGPATLEIAPEIDAAVEDISLFVEAYNEAHAFIRRLQDEDDGPLQGSGDLMRIERQLRTVIHGQVPDIPGSSHLKDSLTYSGTADVSAVASGEYTGTSNQIILEYRDRDGVRTWRHDGKDFQSGEEIHGVTIDIDQRTDPAHGDTLTLEVSPPSKPIKYHSLSAIGIMADDEEGVLRVDDAKLRQSLMEDADSVYRLFAREAPADPAGRGRGPDGVVRQMQNLVKTMIGPGGLVQNRERSLDRELQQYADRIEMIERRLETREQRLVRQFTFMEQYIARIQEQTGLMASFEAMHQQPGDN